VRHSRQAERATQPPNCDLSKKWYVHQSISKPKNALQRRTVVISSNRRTKPDQIQSKCTSNRSTNCKRIVNARETTMRRARSTFRRPFARRHVACVQAQKWSSRRNFPANCQSMMTLTASRLSRTSLGARMKTCCAWRTTPWTTTAKTCLAMAWKGTHSCNS